MQAVPPQTPCHNYNINNTRERERVQVQCCLQNTTAIIYLLGRLHFVLMQSIHTTMRTSPKNKKKTNAPAVLCFAERDFPIFVLDVVGTGSRYASFAVGTTITTTNKLEICFELTG